MKPLTFRCTKLTSEEKVIHTLEKDSTEYQVSLHFDLANEGPGGRFPTGNPFGYVVLTMTPEQYEEHKYEVGKEYLLCAILKLDSVSAE